MHASPSEVETVQKLYSLLPHEAQQAPYSREEKALLENTILYYGRYLHAGSRNYFIQTVLPNLAEAISFFSLRERPNQNIFDLGCGLGMQSILFATLGATVVAMDIRKDSILLCQKRKAYYEQQLQRGLAIQFCQGDFREDFPRGWERKFDGLFSMSAFSYIRPLNRTVQSISSLLKENAKIFIYEGNRSSLYHCFNKGSRRDNHYPSAAETVDAFQSKGFSKCLLRGACSLPWFFWFTPLNFVLHPTNDLLRRNLSLSFRYILGMQRCASALLGQHEEAGGHTGVSSGAYEMPEQARQSPDPGFLRCASSSSPAR